MSLEAWGDDGMDMSGPEGYVTEERAQEYFVGGLVAMREMLARFIEPQDATMAQSIRANWKPEWGKDPGRPDTIYLDGAESP
jgi:hypothetical protein